MARNRATKTKIPNPEKMTSQKTDFGFRKVPLEEKVHRVADVFDSVADKYDIMNDLMSFGLHRLWKRATILLSDVYRGQRVLDLAGGTGDLTRLMARRVGEPGLVVLGDINAAMLEKGRERLTDEGVVSNIEYVRTDAEQLPFPDNSFDCVSIGFGLRNVTRKERALRAMQRVLRPGGRVLILEFSRPAAPLRPFYDAYSFRILPWLGKLVADDSESYRYLAESIRMHPDQTSLKDMMIEAGFARCTYHNFTGGVVALHRGYKED
uniref:Ubiquinone/menaquinone biosynthesis C-methyltransferase UbiE n=1 Tax=Candidatus Kentrum sp. SD TaxID=2126332 RepID=A0A451BQ40_9GAMM|nr:MAG: demethylmenaquinone methyltransferase / 2-methoxy-6-polyprenyl-1,4-benzoquinol methylase [Candidatus Kentron sp. SD]VFK48502.1 MAG: demethylmenaquinone methyltransferase / 2-methoxy-6-polyprenyl-1,4-benzoquinol methylase [Candidatus Kentron sp. SD]VFK80365.1 MAG: demethylmenaquinone methyltransferase / 2-methoxy-6-polyprenyl-1,4-benzoquinol methylase [Candidatus Kentron sp. SD]